MVVCRTLPAWDTLQALFARAAARRSERIVFVRTLREILTRRVSFEPMLLRRDRRRTEREASTSDAAWGSIERHEF